MNRNHILLVDDDPDICTILKDNLEIDGYRVTSVFTGKDALKTFHADSPALVILDLSLPDTDGLQVCRFIRNCSQVPIIILTARDRISDKVVGLECGADDYLVKPFDYLELAARIRACLRRAGLASTHSTIIRSGDVTIDPGKRHIVKSGREIDLTRREFDLLMLLVQNPDRALTRKEIRNAVWPEGRIYDDSRVIDVHIQHLRHKLEEDSTKPELIVTVAGVGYMYCPPCPDA
ncbi:MAG: two-component system, OmpR family, response regulator RpaB [Thermodesulfobacteriota bacterium]|nr:two-component system, OmpR family, response regulator RpaB [Thermodesulfobacteriota bacterium]